MPLFKYKVLDKNGSIQTGLLEGQSKNEVLQKIRFRGEKPISIESQEEEVKEKSMNITIFSPKPKLDDLILFCRQLQTMLHAGMPLIGSLEVLYVQTENLKMQSALQQITTDVKKGTQFSVAMSHHPKVFPSLLINMIEAGEMTGSLDDVLEKMEKNYDNDNKINKQIKQAMIYPIVLLILTFLSVIVMMKWVLPNILGIFEDSGVEIPKLTQIVVNMSKFVQNNWYFLIVFIFVFIFGFIRLLKTKTGKRVKDTIILKIPGIKKNVVRVLTARFTRTLSTLLGSGIPILQALETSASVANNDVLIEKIENVTDSIKKGESLSLLFKDMDFFPAMMVSMVSIGEESGSLETMLQKSAKYYEEELEAALKSLVAIIEPIAIIIMACIIGFIVIAMMLPMFDMASTI